MERFYAAFVLREAIARLDRQRDAIIAALHANSVYDEHAEAKREEAVQNVETHFDEVIVFLKARARGEKTPEEEADDYDESNPFWAAAKRGYERQMAPRVDEEDGDWSTNEMVRTTGADAEMREMLEKLDQV